MTDAQRPPHVIDRPGTPPITLLTLITDTYTDALIQLAYAERDGHDWLSYRQLGYDLIGVGARVIMHASARRDPPTDAPWKAAAEAAQKLQAALRLAEQVATDPADADSVAGEIDDLAGKCAEIAGLLYRISAGLSPAAIAKINPLGANHDTETGDESARQQASGQAG